MNSKIKGNKAVGVLLSELLKRNISVSLPFGDNEKYDLIIYINKQFKSVQVKYGQFKNGCVQADTRHRVGTKRIKYQTYKGKVDFIGIWCEKLNKSYLVPIEKSSKTFVTLRIDNPKNNSSISTIVWAKEFELDNFLKK
jgi:hypothetical protein